MTPAAVTKLRGGKALFEPGFLQSFWEMCAFNTAI